MVFQDFLGLWREQNKIGVKGEKNWIEHSMEFSISAIPVLFALYTGF
jgi:hypothetical protein